MARSTSNLLNLKATQPYKTYKYIPIPTITSCNRDNLDRFFIRIKKIMVCTQYLKYLIKFYEKNLTCLPDVNRKTTFTTYSEESSIEELIKDFKSNMKRYLITNNKTYLNIESPKGYFDTHCVSSKRSINRP